jgi:serine/threonine-protein kinase
MDSDKYIGRLLDNRYEILEVLGVGGMAIVYKARCHRLNRLVAIKILKDEYSQDEEFCRRFHAEGEAVAMLGHPNIVSVYDVSNTGAADYIVMELIDGISLKQYMEKKGVLNWKETLHFAIQICKALEHAHSRGLVHRDIKPHNIMVLKNGSIKVTDFGIARVMSKSNTLTKEALGSVHYISPEQAKGGRVDDRSDLYSLGTVMYEMITGRPPYDGESPVAVAIQHINGGARMPSTLNPNIPGGLEQIIMKAMAHEPADRYASATAMLYDMDEFRKLPSILFDYNLPPIDAVMNLKNSQPAPKTAAERAAEAGSPVRRRETGRNLDLRQKSTARAALARSRMRRRSKEEYDEDDSRSRTAVIAVIACSVVAIIAIVIFFMLLLNGGSDAPQLVMVPTLVGKNYENYKSNGDVVLSEPEFVYDDSFDKGQICFQSHKPGEKVEKGTIISIKVSKGPTPEVKLMENLINQKQDIAKNFLTKQGVAFLVETENDDTVEKDHVIRTNPAAGEEIKDGQTVVLYISMGPEMKEAKVPAVTNQSLETAKTILNMQGVKIDIQVKEEDNDTVEKGDIIRTEPAAGEMMKTGDTVIIYISNGPKTAKMPNLVGKSLKDALELLEYAGFTNVKYDAYVENEAPRDQVLYQSVEMNVEVPLNSKIELQLSTGVKEVTFGLVEGTVEPYSVKIVRKDNDKVVFEGTMENGESEVKLKLTGKGTVTYVITIEGLGEREEKVDFDTP